MSYTIHIFMASTTDLVNFFGWLTIALPTQQASRIAIGGDGGLGFGGMARDFSRFERIFFYGYPEKKYLLSEDVFLQGKTILYTSHELVFGESLQGPTMFDGTNPRGFFSNFYGNSIIHICVSLTYLISQENITNIRLKPQQSARRRNLTREKQANIGPKQKSSSNREFTLNIQETI
jgi:hypothetical protein